jgi:tetratricopeptide (TPR) repeat protein
MKQRLLVLFQIVPAILAWLFMLLPVETPATDRMEMRIKVSTLLKESRQMYHAAQYDSALVLLDQIQKLDPNNQDAFYILALNYLAMADSGKAISTLNQGIKLAPLSSRLKLLLARLHLKNNNLDEAGTLITTVLRFKTKHSEALYLKGLLSLAQGDTLKTLESWQSALEHLPPWEGPR